MIEKICIGTAQFGLNYGVANKNGKISLEEARKILNYAKGQGIQTLDTAIGYGDSEKVLGQIGVHNWNVVTKLPSLPLEINSGIDWIKNTALDSLKRLKKDSIYGMLLHRPQDLLSKRGEEIYKGLTEIRACGYVKKIGISIYDPTELEPLLNHFEFDLIQVPMNVLDRRMITSGWLEKLKQKNIEVHIRSVFLQGLLLMKRKERPEKFNRWENVWKKWEDFLVESKVSALASCLQFVIENLQVDKVVLGVDSLGHIEEIVAKGFSQKVKIPEDLFCEDIKLLNPSLWVSL
jgi:aryl-alcohol dehydrogenase-like predicted oxidoreductase